MKTLVILGHPQSDSLCGALAEAYARGASSSGASLEVLRLGELRFDPVQRERRGYAGTDADLEPDLQRAQEMIERADQLVFVFPSWWGTMPALLKGFVDRAFLPGFAFKPRKGSAFPEKLLKGKTARIIVTMDTPSFWHALIYRAPAENALRRATLEFCGVRPVRVTRFDRVRSSSPETRTRWLEKARTLGAHDAKEAHGHPVLAQ